MTLGRTAVQTPSGLSCNTSLSLLPEVEAKIGEPSLAWPISNIGESSVLVRTFVKMIVYF